MTNAKDLKWSKLENTHQLHDGCVLVKEDKTGFLMFGYFAENVFVVKDYDTSWNFEFSNPPYSVIDLELPQ